jgi:hypothetical protein
VEEAIQEIIDAAKHNTLADDPVEARIELDDQAKEKVEKEKRVREQEIEQAILTSTQRTREAYDKTIEEIMTGVESKEGKK